MSYTVDELEEAGRLARLFLYGQEKTKKTWWIGRAAEAGYNVIYLDGDDGALILKNLKPETKKRVGVVNLVQERDRTVFPEFVAQFLRPGNSFVWDVNEKRTVIGLKNPEHGHLVVNASKLTDNDIVVVDSHTAMSIDCKHRYAKENKIDLTDAERTDWDGYGYEGNFLTYYLVRLRTLPCHVCVIGHETVYEKRSKDQKTILSQTTQPVSSSGPHAKTIGRNFSDILYFSKLSAEAFYIDTGGDKDRIGGGRLMPPKVYRWEDLHPSAYLDATGSKGDPTKPCEGFVYYPPGTIPDNINIVPQIGLVTKPPAQASAVKVLPAEPSGGKVLASLFAKKT